MSHSKNMFSLFCRETKLPRKELSSKPTPICISQELKSFTERSMKPVRWILMGEVLAWWLISPTWRKLTTAHLKYIINYSMYSTHQTIRYTPLFSVHSYGTTCLRKSANTTRTAWARFFFFFSWVDLMTIYIFYTHKIVVGLTPMALRYRSLY
jgi:hypothetical protein